MERERHLLVVVSVVLAAFLICWTPFWVVNLVTIKIDKLGWQHLLDKDIDGTDCTPLF